jgi:hypothetical protein
MTISDKIARSTGMTDAFLDASITSGQKQLADAITRLEERIIDETWKLQTGTRGNLLSPKVNLKQAQKIHADLTTIFDETYGKEARKVSRRYASAAQFIQRRWRELDLAMDFTSVDRDILDTISKTNFNEFRRFGKAAEEQIARAMYDSVAAQTDIKELRKRISEALTGQLDKRGRPMAVYADQFVHDGMMAYAQALTLKKSKDGGFNHYLYVGNLMKTSRPFCIARAGRVYSRKEIESWTFSWSGKAGPALTHRGGYRCRHHWQPVKPEWVDEIEKDGGFQEKINLVSDKTTRTLEELERYGVKPNTKQALFVETLIDNPMTNAQIKALAWNKSQNLFKDLFQRLEGAGLAEVLENGKRVIRAAPAGFKMPKVISLPNIKKGYNEFGYKLGSKADLFIKELQKGPLTNDQIRALSWNKASNLYPDVYRKVKGFGYAGVDEAGRKFIMIPGSTAETPIPAALVSPKKAPLVSQKFYKPKTFDEASKYMDELLTAEKQFLKELSEIDEEWAGRLHTNLSNYHTINQSEHFNLSLADIEDAEKAFKAGLAPEAEEVVHRFFSMRKEGKKARTIYDALGPMDSKEVKEKTTSILNQYVSGDIGQPKANRLFEELADRRFAHRPTVFDFEAQDPVLSKVMVDSVDELDRAYPGVMERLRYYGTYEGDLTRWTDDIVRDMKPSLRLGRPVTSRFKWEDKVYAHASTDGKRIAHNPNWYGSDTKLDRAINYNQATRWFVRGEKVRHGSELISTHEFGHQVHNWLDEKYNGMGSAISRAFGKLVSKNRISRNFVSEYAMYKAKGFGNRAAELMAEMFANSRHAVGTDKAPLTRFYERLLDFTTNRSTSMQRYDMRKALNSAAEYMDESNTISDVVSHIKVNVKADTWEAFEQSMEKAGNVMARKP